MSIARLNQVTPKEYMRDKLLSEVFGKYEEEWQNRLMDMCVKNANFHTFAYHFVYKGVVYEARKVKLLPAIKTRLDPSLFSEMEGHLAWKNQVESSRRPVHALLTSAMIMLPFERVEEIIPMALIHHLSEYKEVFPQKQISDQEMARFKYTHHHGINVLMGKLMDNLLFS